jgi:hypothetical protein
VTTTSISADRTIKKKKTIRDGRDSETKKNENNLVMNSKTKTLAQHPKRIMNTPTHAGELAEAFSIRKIVVDETENGFPSLLNAEC